MNPTEGSLEPDWPHPSLLPAATTARRRAKNQPPALESSEADVGDSDGLAQAGSPPSITPTRTSLFCRVVEALCFLRMLAVIAIVSNLVFITFAYAVLPFLLLPLPIACTFHIAVVLAYSVTYTGDPATTGWRTWPEFQYGFFMQDIIRWFHGDVVKTVDLEPNRQYVFAFAPHGTVVLFFLPCPQSGPNNSFFFFFFFLLFSSALALLCHLALHPPQVGAAVSLHQGGGSGLLCLPLCPPHQGPRHVERDPPC